MKISIIAAVANNNVIGHNNNLPWAMSQKSDLKRFKELTTGHTVIMGRKTFESMGRVLPNRTNIILTRNHDFHIEGAITVNNLNSALDIASSQGETEAFIIGGAEIFAQGLPLANKIYFTRVDIEAEGNIFFPPINFDEWALVSQEKHLKDDSNLYSYTFETYERKNK
jgi:dihydrofolate reductase